MRQPGTVPRGDELLAEAQVVASIFGSSASDEGVGPLAASLCTVTVRLGAPFAVSDACDDPRVRDLPPVTSEGAADDVALLVLSQLPNA